MSVAGAQHAMECISLLERCQCRAQKLKEILSHPPESRELGVCFSGAIDSRSDLLVEARSEIDLDSLHILSSKQPRDARLFPIISRRPISVILRHDLNNPHLPNSILLSFKLLVIRGQLLSLVVSAYGKLLFRNCCITYVDIMTDAATCTLRLRMVPACGISTTWSSMDKKVAGIPCNSLPRTRTHFRGN